MDVKAQLTCKWWALAGIRLLCSCSSGRLAAGRSSARRLWPRLFLQHLPQRRCRLKGLGRRCSKAVNRCCQLCCAEWFRLRWCCGWSLWLGERVLSRFRGRRCRRRRMRAWACCRRHGGRCSRRGQLCACWCCLRLEVRQQAGVAQRQPNMHNSTPDGRALCVQKLNGLQRMAAATDGATRCLLVAVQGVRRAGAAPVRDGEYRGAAAHQARPLRDAGVQ